MSLPPKIKPSSIVNAYLFYAQRLLQFENTTQNIRTDADKRVISASVCLCLKQAWQAWLDELGRYLNKNLSSFEVCLLPEHRTHPEIEALLTLQKQPGNWLSQLLLCLEPMVHSSPSVAHDEQTDGGEQTTPTGRIQALQLDVAAAGSFATDVPKDLEAFVKLIDAFKAHIASVRARQEEW